MPLGTLLETTIQAVGELVLEGIGYQTARVLVPALSFGRVQVEPLASDEKGRPKRKRMKPGAELLRQRPDGRWLMSVDLAVLIGLLFWMGVAVAGFLIWWLS